MARLRDGMAWRLRLTFRRGMQFLILLVCFGGVVHFAVAAEAAPRPLSLPRDLAKESLEKLVSGELAADLSEDILSLYHLEASTSERRAAAERLRNRLHGPGAGSVRNIILRRVDLVDAGLQAAEHGMLSEEDITRVEAIVAAASRFEDTNLAEDANLVRGLWRELRDNVGAMESLRPVFMKYYFNYNAHVTVSEHMLARLMQDHHTERGSIAECILGAWVTGSQVTQATVTVDVKRSASRGHLLLQLHGQTTTNTQGRRKPVTVFTQGNHTFDIQCPVWFDGQTLSAGQATIDVNANNQTVGLRTDYDGVPLLGHFARSIARTKAREKRRQSEAIAAGKLANRALPEFVREVNDLFDEANASLRRDLFDGLQSKGVGPDSFSSRSSDTHLAISSRTMGLDRVAGAPQPFAPLPLRGLAVQLHETAINNVLDGLEFNGRVIPEDDLFDELEKSLGELLQREFILRGDQTDDGLESESENGEADPPATFLFYENDPIRLHFEHDSVVLVLRTGVEQEGKDPVPPQRISVPIRVTLENGRVVFTPPEDARDISVASLDGTRGFRQVGRAQQIRRLLTAKLRRREIDAGVGVSPTDTKSIELRTVSVSMNDGWLYVELE